VSRSRPLDRSTFMTYSKSEVHRVRQTIETLCMIMGIIGQAIADEHIGILTVISLIQE
jgi:hypothetical protein